MTITDKLLKQYFDIIEEKYDNKRKLLSIKYTTDFKNLNNNCVIFNIKEKRIIIEGNFRSEVLELIYNKCKELNFFKIGV